MSYPKALVRHLKDGKIILEDPDAEAVIRAVAKHNCRALFDLNADRVHHFVARMHDREDNPAEVCITLINVDDPHGALIADKLMPGHDWQAYRDRGEVPIARGLAGREGLQEVLGLFDVGAAAKLRGIEGIAILVVDQGVAEIFTPADLADPGTRFERKDPL